MLPIAVGFKFGLEKRHLGGNAKYAVQPFSGIMQKTIGLDKSTQKTPEGLLFQFDYNRVTSLEIIKPNISHLIFHEKE